MCIHVLIFTCAYMCWCLHARAYRSEYSCTYIHDKFILYICVTTLPYCVSMISFLVSTTSFLFLRVFTCVRMRVHTHTHLLFFEKYAHFTQDWHFREMKLQQQLWRHNRCLPPLPFIPLAYWSPFFPSPLLFFPPPFFSWSRHTKSTQACIFLGSISGYTDRHTDTHTYAHTHTHNASVAGCSIRTSEKHVLVLIRELDNQLSFEIAEITPQMHC